MKTHEAVLTEKVIEFLKPEPGKIFVDATVGSGNHSTAILEAAGGKCFILGIDKDSDALKRAEENLRKFTGSFCLVKGGYEDLPEHLKRAGMEKVDGVLFDLGFSSEEISDASRGFSFLLDGPLDMRYDKESPLTAADIINRSSREELTRAFREYAEFGRPEKIVERIIERRRQQPFERTSDLANFFSRVYRNRNRRLHPATLFFQALRIAVNDEIENLKTGLEEAWLSLNAAGRIVVISFHSLEDRIVKRFFRQKTGLAILTKKPVRPDRIEISLNPRARSAKLRAGEKT